MVAVLERDWGLKAIPFPLINLLVVAKHAEPFFLNQFWQVCFDFHRLINGHLQFQLLEIIWPWSGNKLTLRGNTTREKIPTSTSRSEEWMTDEKKEATFEMPRGEEKGLAGCLCREKEVEGPLPVRSHLNVTHSLSHVFKWIKIKYDGKCTRKGAFTADKVVEAGV